ncbi:hypothetical protein CKO28_25025 [Rhodovibrio sodomensis]|uniref:DUF3179 domain-containing protein n=1 Tax=Rhodovibrio sodomensis TaxID=1088 RepID=A0ABS1DMD5_9PROT|nr:DUF3179 domain-containing protein [Rhodovibrio sodomensis]MBK1671267.1 hypothetical protein [Rhodovibrio sodomensis]
MPKKLDRRSLLKAGLATGAVGSVGAGIHGMMRPGDIFVGASHAATPPPFPTGDTRPVQAAFDTYRDAMQSGGPGKDGIPSIDDPVFIEAHAADSLDDGDIVFGIEPERDRPKAYPQKILVQHEIANDRVDGTGLAVTYCPLTGTAIGFARQDITFGVSGRLLNSNLVMYDRASDTWFPQVLSVGIKGPHTGAFLREYPMVWTTWGRWRRKHPDTRVLSTDTGYFRNYQRDPYGSYNPVAGYYEPDSRLMFPVLNRDNRFPAKHMVLGARTSGGAAAFSLDRLSKDGRIEAEVGGERLVARYEADLDTGYVHRKGASGERITAFQAMWFAWYAFYPETAVYA